MRSERDAAGVWHHTIHQSDLTEFHHCPEKLRTKKGEGGSDATAVGTAVHVGIEAYLHNLLLVKADLETAAIQHLETEWPNVRKIQMKSKGEAISAVRNSVSAFWEGRSYFPHGGWIERQFTLNNVYEDALRTISFRGTIDYFVNGMIFDWKTTARSYHEGYWRVQRYAVQPTMYCMAVYALTGIMPKFTFVRLPKDGFAMEMATVERDTSDFQALVLQGLNLATLIESDTPTWPMMPTDWHCSAKWCDTLRRGECLGAELGSKPWNVSFMDGVPVTIEDLNANR